MKRKQFLLQCITGIMSNNSLFAFNQFTSQLPLLSFTMPVLFIGHGSPMNGIENNSFSAGWANMATTIPQPTAVLVVSAHWLTIGTHITAMPHPRTIHDFGGFPPQLYQVQYPAPGSPTVAAETANMVQSASVQLNHDWGLDHGTWTVVRHMYPTANIPVLQLSIDANQGPQYHYQLAAELALLRKKGVLIIGSGNMVHNLGMVAWHKLQEPEYGYDWALEINQVFKQLITNKQHDSLINYHQLGKKAEMAIPTNEHYLPLLYTLALQTAADEVSFFNDKAVGGSLTMTSVKIG